MKAWHADVLATEVTMTDFSQTTNRVLTLLFLVLSIGVGPLGCGGTKSTTADSGAGYSGGNVFVAGSGAFVTNTGSGGVVTSGGSSGAVGGQGGAGSGGTIAGASGTVAGASGTIAGTSGVTSGTGGDSGVGATPIVFNVEHRLASEIDPAAPGTIGVVTWSVNLNSIDTAQIEFGLDTGYGMTAPVDLNEAEYRTLLLGMKPDRAYHFRIVAQVGATTHMSDDYVINTGPPTNLVRLGSFNVINETARERGFIVTSYWQGQGSTMAFIIDADGEIVWWYQSSVNGIARARMSEDGKNMWMIMADPMRGGPLERVTMDTLDGQIYNGTIGSHDLTPVKGAKMAYLDYSERDCDSIFEIDPGGNTVEIFESSDVVTGMGCHGNALRYSQKEDVYTFSDVSQDVFIVNRSGGVDWRLSEIVNGGNSAWGGTQHGHQLLDNSIIIFANRSGGRNASEAIEYTLNGEEIMRYRSGHFSANLGDVQRLPGGNTLVTYSNNSFIQEIDSQGTLVLEINGGGSSFGYALWRKSLYGPPPDILQ